MFRHQLVRALLAHFAERAGYSGPLRVFTRREHFDRLCRGRKVPLTTDERAAYAVTLYGRVPTTWFALDRHRGIRSLANSAAHEAIHIARGPEFPCETANGRRVPAFDAEVRRLLRGGD